MNVHNISMNATVSNQYGDISNLHHEERDWIIQFAGILNSTEVDEDTGKIKFKWNLLCLFKRTTIRLLPQCHIIN